MSGGLPGAYDATNILVWRDGYDEQNLSTIHAETLKLMPCLAKFAAALASSHSYSTYETLPDTGTDRQLRSWSSPMAKFAPLLVLHYVPEKA
jgi:hypothetical protein